MHPYMFITENYSSKFMIMSFWAPALKSPAENSIPKNVWICHWFISLIVNISSSLILLNDLAACATVIAQRNDFFSLNCLQNLLKIAVNLHLFGLIGMIHSSYA